MRDSIWSMGTEQARAQRVGMTVQGNVPSYERKREFRSIAEHALSVSLSQAYPTVLGFIEICSLSNVPQGYA